VATFAILSKECCFEINGVHTKLACSRDYLVVERMIVDVTKYSSPSDREPAFKHSAILALVTNRSAILREELEILRLNINICSGRLAKLISHGTKAVNIRVLCRLGEYLYLNGVGYWRYAECCARSKRCDGDLQREWVYKCD